MRCVGTDPKLALLYSTFTIMQSPRVPWEIIERIIGHSRHRPDSLRSFSLTCRELHPRSRCLMLATGVKLNSRDHAFALVDFLEDNPNLTPFISSIIVRPTDLPPFPLLRILSNLSEIVFIMKSKESAPALMASAIVSKPIFLHPSYLAAFQKLGTHIQTLCLIDIVFPTSLAFAQLIVALPTITRLICQHVTIQKEGTQATLAVTKHHLSKKLRLRSLVVSI